MLRYAISDLFPAPAPATPEARQAQLSQQLQRWLIQGVAFIQLREKTLDPADQLSLAAYSVGWLDQLPPASRRPLFLVNGRADIAAAAGADGVHLTGSPGELHPDQARDVFRSARLARCVVSVSCHSLEDVHAARRLGADLILFAPVFEKVVAQNRVSAGQGLTLLQEACRVASPTPVLALGGVTNENTPACLDAGAAGVAGIRLFA